MTQAEAAKAVGASHVAVLKWEREAISNVTGYKAYTPDRRVKLSKAGRSAAGARSDAPRAAVEPAKSHMLR
jgi:hypothetical protein